MARLINASNTIYLIFVILILKGLLIIKSTSYFVLFTIWNIMNAFVM